MPQLFVIRRLKNFAYDANNVYEVPQEHFDLFVSENAGRAPEPVLDTDIPHREKLLALGVSRKENINEAIFSQLSETEAAEVVAYLKPAPVDTIAIAKPAKGKK